MEILVRHSIPGRTRLELDGWVPAAEGQAFRRLLKESGVRVASANPVSRRILLLHDRAEAPEAIVASVADALTGAATARDEVEDDRFATAPTGKLAEEANGFCTADAEDVMVRTAATRGGLSGDEALDRLGRHGANVVPEIVGRSGVDILFRQLATAPVALLVGSAVLSIATGGLFDAAVTLGVIAINAAVGAASEESTERLIRRLSRPVAHPASALRDGRVTELAASDIVPGDIIVLAPGSVVPADARVIEARDLSVDESMLTGESIPVDKIAEPLARAPTGIADRQNIVHAGTVVTGGGGLACVFRTGRFTEMAQTRDLIGTAHAPRPAMEHRLAKVSSQLTIGCIGISGLVFTVGMMRGEPIVAMARSAIALAVAAIPEGLPAVATTTMALGARALEKEGAFVRSLPAVEAIGSVDTICLDKTGTLTQNRMAVVAASTGSGTYNIEAGGTWSNQAEPGLMALAEAVALCNEANLATESGSATEIALLGFSEELGLDVGKLRSEAPIIGLRNRNHIRHWMGTEHRRENGTELAIKGAPEEVVAISEWELVNGSRRPLNDKRREEILASNQVMARRGLRVLGVARGEGAFGDEPVGELVWLGMVGLADPIRPEAREAIDVLHRAGVRTLLITGDQAPTALSIAETLALSRSGVINVVEGWQLASLDDDAVAELASRTSVFARVSPSEKLRIVHAMQRAGKRVAMIGDGVNDGPALRAASVGIAIGAKDSSVAREVADIVIANDDLGDLARVVARGRATEDNVRSAMRYLLATNFSEIVVTVVEALRGRAELETPMELFWLNLVTDIMPALGLALAEPRGDVMSRPPVAADAPLFSRQEIRTLIGDGSGVAFAGLGAHFLELGLVGPGPQTRSATFLALALSQIAYAWVLRDRSPNAGQALQISERRLEGFLLAAGALLALPFLAPPLQRVLGIAPLSFGRLAMASALAAGSFAAAETRRLVSATRTTAAASQASPPDQTK